MNLLDKLNWSRASGRDPKSGDGAMLSAQAGETAPAYHGQGRGRPLQMLLGLEAQANGWEIGSWVLAMTLIALGIFVLMLNIIGF